jgi:hypothetical protein
MSHYCYPCYISIKTLKISTNYVALKAWVIDAAVDDDVDAGGRRGRPAERTDHGCTAMEAV